jgi:hypothetical protein
MSWSEELCRHVAISWPYREAFDDHDASRPTKLRVDAKGLKVGSIRRMPSMRKDLMARIFKTGSADSLGQMAAERLSCPPPRSSGAPSADPDTEP